MHGTDLDDEKNYTEKNTAEFALRTISSKNQMQLPANDKQNFKTKCKTHREVRKISRILVFSFVDNSQSLVNSFSVKFHLSHFK